MSARRYRKWDGANSIFRVLLALVLLFVLAFVVGPILYELSFVGDHHGYRASCQSNMKQLALALYQYTQDSDGMLPNYMAADGRGWREATYPFVKSTGVYQCPDDKRDESRASPDNLPKSYAANHLGPNNRGQERGTGRTTYGVEQPQSRSSMIHGCAFL